MLLTRSSTHEITCSRTFFHRQTPIFADICWVRGEGGRTLFGASQLTFCFSFLGAGKKLAWAISSHALDWHQPKEGSKMCLFTVKRRRLPHKSATGLISKRYHCSRLEVKNITNGPTINLWLSSKLMHVSKVVIKLILCLEWDAVRRNCNFWFQKDTKTIQARHKM